MTSLSDVKQAEIIEAFNSTSRYLDDLLNIDNPYFEGMVNRIYPPELQLNKANTADTEAPFLDLHLSISNGFVSSKNYDNGDDFDFDIVSFPFLDGDVSPLYLLRVYISQLRACCPSILVRSIAIELSVPRDDFSSIAIELTCVILRHGFKKSPL